MNPPGSQWFKSSHSSEDNDGCVEVAITPQTVHVRDSKDRGGGQLALSPAAWTDFLAYLGSRLNDDFDHA